MKNKWKLITGIALMSPMIIGMLIAMVMVAIKSPMFLALLSLLCLYILLLCGANLYADWSNDNDEM